MNETKNGSRPFAKIFTYLQIFEVTISVFLIFNFERVCWFILIALRWVRSTWKCIGSTKLEVLDADEVGVVNEDFARLLLLHTTKWLTIT